MSTSIDSILNQDHPQAEVVGLRDDSARQINTVVLPEYNTQASLCVLFLLTGYWVFCLISLPYLYFSLTLLL
ncbi:Probable protein cornichon homolog 2 [Linum perenne]